MGTRNISISHEAYSRLAALKGPKESFTDVINRLAGKKSVLDLGGVLTAREAEELLSRVRRIRSDSVNVEVGKTRKSYFGASRGIGPFSGEDEMKTHD